MEVAATTPAPQTRSSFSSLLFITFVLFLMSGNGDDPTAHLQMRDSLRSLVHQRSNYTAWLNGTDSNFTLAREPPSLRPLLEVFLPNHPPINSATSSYYHNITGFLNGPAHFNNLTSSTSETWGSLATAYIKDVNLTESWSGQEKWGWTDLERVSLNIREHKAKGFEDSMNFLHGNLELISREKGSSTDFQVAGIHFPSNGSFYALVEPNGMIPDIRHLSALVPGDAQNNTAYAVGSELSIRISKIQAMVDAGVTDPDISSPTSGGSCPFHLYGHLTPSLVSAYLMEELEHEMEDPEGITTVSRPPIVFNGVLISRPCGILIEIKDATGLRADRFWRKTTTYTGFAILAYFILLLLLVRQMEITQTPAAISKISRWTFALQAVIDSYAFVFHITIGLVSNNRATLSLVAPGFLAAILFLVFEVRYITLTHRIQAPEDALVNAQPTPTTAVNGEAPASTGGTAPVSAPPSRRIARALNQLTDPESKSWMIVLLLFVLVVQFPMSSRIIISAISMLYSFWVPQIVRNARRGTRKALQKRYVIGTSAARLFFPLYVYACPENVLFMETNEWIWLVVAWVWFQVLVLLGQEYLGSSFFLPRGWVTVQIFDYHPALPVPDPEAPEQSLGDCSICMDAIVVPTELLPGGGTKGGLLMNVAARRTYALAPCHHLFHTSCLEQWLAIKNICPQCRRPLPPL